MLSQMQRLVAEVDGRYATDSELQFIQDYMASFKLRLSAYVKLQNAEATIVQQVYTRMQRMDSNLLKHGDADVTAKWKRDTIRALRYSAIAMLLNDPDILQERFLFWFQTIMKAFGTQQSCNVT
ncbi:MAG: phycobilisome protein, partial [Cyanobacteriota bacterium SKYGB_h_bin112]|nr:phycobilisome protein [Cyanobacteriota bacterium SKYGB_h_bin112]